MPAKHHPGPLWVEYDEQDRAVAIRVHPDDADFGTAICEMNSSRSPEETKANAILFAAAPRLLSMAESVMNYLQFMVATEQKKYPFRPSPQGQTVLRYLAEAIAEAKGETK